MKSRKITKGGLPILALFLALAVWVTPALAITGGDPDGETHPNVGVIIVDLSMVEHDIEPFMICSGTLIHPQVFLTAGHCTDYLDYLFSLYTADEMKVYVSFNAVDAITEGWLPVNQIITHPDYDWGPASNPHDVGVLILEQDSDIPPAPLPEEGFLDQLKAEGKLKQGSDRAKFTVVGYGTTLEWPPPKIIDPDGVRRVAVSEYLNLRKVWLHMSQP